MAGMPSRRAFAASLIATFVAAGPGAADTVNSPECRRNLTAANQSISAIRAREKSFVPGDLPTNCKLLKLNLADLVKARAPMDRCLAGPERNETLAQLDAAIGDIRSVLAAKCQK
jgi:hypothetical protein